MTAPKTEGGNFLSPHLRATLGDAGLLVVIYPLFCVAYQVGFFWDASVSFLPIFSYTEHMLNASGPFVVLAILFTSTMLYIFPFLAGRLIWRYRPSYEDPKSDTPSGDDTEILPAKGFRRLIYAITALATLGFSVYVLYMLTFTKAQLVVFSFLFCMYLMMSFSFLQKVHSPNIYKALNRLITPITFLLFVPAVGSMHFYSIIMVDDIGLRALHNSRTCKLVMYGSERSLLGCGSRLNLVRNEEFQIAGTVDTSDIFKGQPR